MPHEHAIIELHGLARRMISLLAGLMPGQTSGTYGRTDQDRLLQYAKYTIQIRRRRDAIFPGLFADAAWDILLDLYVAGLEGRATSVSSACIASSVPATTALRAIKLLEHEGLLIRIPDRADGRRIHLRLSEKAEQKMIELLGGIRGIAGNADEAVFQH